jgi:hypothetical protein
MVSRTSIIYGCGRHVCFLPFYSPLKDKLLVTDRTVIAQSTSTNILCLKTFLRRLFIRCVDQKKFTTLTEYPVENDRRLSSVFDHYFVFSIAAHGWVT